MINRFTPPRTPALVIDRAALMHNLSAMQAACDAKDVRLRAHGKMHKCSRLGQWQVEMGAVGLCCQTVGEVEAFARAGISDLLLSAPAPVWGAEKLASVAKETGAHIAVVCDSKAQIDRLEATALAAGVELGCFVDVNIGMHRVGCTVEEALDLARLASDAPNLSYKGVQAYFGHLQHAPDRKSANAEGTAILKALVGRLGDEGLHPPQVTGGGTGTYAFDLDAGVFTELQCGSYALMDAEYQECGGPGGEWPFQPALFIAASVISARHKGHVTIDAGLKANSADVSARVVSGAAPGSLWRSLGDEHGAVVHPALFPELKKGRDSSDIDADPNIPWPSDAPGEGDIVWLQPGHCDPTINLYDGIWVVDEGGSPEFWPIDARRLSA